MQAIATTSAGDEHQQREEEADAAAQQLDERPHDDSRLRVRRRVLLLQLLGDGGEVTLRLFERGARLQARADEERASVAARARGVEFLRDPHIGVNEDASSGRCGDDADERVRDAIEEDVRADDVGPGGEALAPIAIGQERHAWRAYPAVLGPEASTHGDRNLPLRGQIRRGADQ